MSSSHMTRCKRGLFKMASYAAVSVVLIVPAFLRQESLCTMLSFITAVACFICDHQTKDANVFMGLTTIIYSQYVMPPCLFVSAVGQHQYFLLPYSVHSSQNEVKNLLLLSKGNVNLRMLLVHFHVRVKTKRVTRKNDNTNSILYLIILYLIISPTACRKLK